jgi:hypothetical protein
MKMAGSRQRRWEEGKDAMKHGWMVDGLRRVEPLLIEAELLHADLCLSLMCSPR